MPGKDREPTLEDLMGGDEPETEIEALEEEVFEDGVDPHHAVLSVEEQRQAKADARAAIDAERHKKALAAFIAKEKDRLRREEGLTTGDGVKDELVEILIDLPEFADRLVVNFEPFMHGRSYRVPRHVADSLREQQSRMWDHEREIKGQGIKDRIANEAVRAMRPVAVLRGKAA